MPIPIKNTPRKNETQTTLAAVEILAER